MKILLCKFMFFVKISLQTCFQAKKKRETANLKSNISVSNLGSEI